MRRSLKKLRLVSPARLTHAERGEGPAFDAARAMETIRALESFGVRVAGSGVETRAAEWLLTQLQGLGYEACMEEVALPNGRTSHNVVARAAGTSHHVVVLGAHIDSEWPSPGANDNASGCAAVLEIARMVAERPVTPTMEFAFFGAEESMDRVPGHQHYGSRFRVAAMSDVERANVAGMICLDTIAFGTQLTARTMLRGPQGMCDLVISQAERSCVPLTFAKHRGAGGGSDYEAYELAGIPAVWIQWRKDPLCHTAGDTSRHCDPQKVLTIGSLVLDVLRSLGPLELARLVSR